CRCDEAPGCHRPAAPRLRRKIQMSPETTAAEQSESREWPRPACSRTGLKPRASLRRLPGGDEIAVRICSKAAFGRRRAEAIERRQSSPVIVAKCGLGFGFGELPALDDGG